MTTEKKAKLKKTVTGWLCFAALTSGVVVPANLPSVFPTITVSAEEAYTGEINLDNLANYLNNTPLPVGVSISALEQFGGYVEIQISESGKYKLTGSNKVGDAYYDVRIKITNSADVTLVCEDVFIKNDNPPKKTNNPSEVFGVEYVENYSGFYIYNYVTPFKTEDSAQLTIKGKLYADTAFAVESNGSGRLAAPLSNGENINCYYMQVCYYENTKDGGEYFDENYCLPLNEEDEPYDIRKYIDTNTYKCISVEQHVDSGFDKNYRFTGWTDVILRNSHSLSGDSTTCANCGKDLTVNSIMVSQNPKTSYKEGEKFDPTGLVITVNYNNEESENITYSENSGITFAPAGSLKSTDTVVTFTYEGKTATFPIIVTKKSSGGVSSGGGSSHRPSTPIPDPEPQIGGSNGKTGWDAVVEEIKDAKDGDSIKINMNGATLLKGNALSAVAGKNIDLILDMGNGLTWTIKGNTITNTAGVDLGVHFTSGKSCGIPVEVINLLTGESEYITLELDHIGDFGFTAILTVNMGSKNKGNYANLYYYRESKKTTEFISAGQIDDKGNAKLAFTHASEYVIMIDDHPHGTVPGGDTSESKPDTSDTTSDTSDTSSNTSDTSSNTSDTSSDTSDTSSNTSDTSSDTSNTTSDTSDTSNSNSDSGNDGNANPDTGIMIGYGALLISGAVALVSRKKRSKK